MRWLHISDLHVDSNAYPYESLPIEQMEAYLKSEKIVVDYVIISGDLRFAKGKSSDSIEQDSQLIVARIISLAQTVGVTNRDKIIVAAGNHDLDRTKDGRQYTLRGFKEEYSKRLDEGDLSQLNFYDVKKQLIGAFEFYYRVFELLYSPQTFAERWHGFSEKFHYTVQFSDMNFLVLNSSLLSIESKTDEGSLFIGHNHVLSAIQSLDTKKPTIAVSHHNIDFIHQKERVLITYYFGLYKIKLLLSGHSHVTGHYKLNDIRCITMGCIKNAHNVKCSFSVGTFNEKNYSTAIKAYEWSTNWSPSSHFGRVNVTLSPLGNFNKASYSLIPSTYFDEEIDDEPNSIYTEDDFLQSLKTCHTDSAVSYLLSGPLGEEAISRKMPVSLFYKHFFVPDNMENEEKINNLAVDLFSSVEHNMLCLLGEAGTGKTTFLQSLANKYHSMKHDGRNLTIDYIVLNCVKSHTNSQDNKLQQHFPSEDLRQKFRKLLRKMLHAAKNHHYDWYNDFCNTLRKIVALQIGSLVDSNVEILQSHAKILIAQIGQLTEDDYSYSQIISSVFDHSNDFSKLALYTALLITKRKISKRKNIKYIIVFDNIEAYIASSSSIIGDQYFEIISELHRLFDTIQKQSTDAFGIPLDFMKDFTFVLCVRPTTKLALTSIHMDGKVFGDQDKYKFVRRYYNFTIEAILKKLKYLHVNQIDTGFAREVRKVVELLIPSRVVSTYLQSESYDVNDDDLKKFVSLKYLPFFNNDFRTAVRELKSLYNKKCNGQTWMDHVLKLNNSHSGEADDIFTNASRMIIFKNIFDNYVDNGYLQLFGLDYLDGQEKYSIMRFILSLLYWDQVFNPKTDVDYEGMSLAKVIQACSIHFEKDQIISTLRRLSIDDENNELKIRAVSEWAYFVSFVRGIENNDIPSSLANSALAEEITVKLTPAGWCFVDYISSQFEFFSARLVDAPKEALVLYTDKSVDGKYEFENILNLVYDGVRRCVNGLTMDLCATRCFNCDRSHSNCDYFIRMQEVFSVLTSQIDYIDRFRRKMWETYKDKLINEKILDAISRYLMVYSEFHGYKESRRTCFAISGNLSENRQAVERIKAMPYYGVWLNSDDVKRLIVMAKSKVFEKSIFGFIKSESQCTK